MLQLLLLLHVPLLQLLRLLLVPLFHLLSLLLTGVLLVGALMLLILLLLEFLPFLLLLLLKLLLLLLVLTVEVGIAGAGRRMALDRWKLIGVNRRMASSFIPWLFRAAVSRRMVWRSRFTGSDTPTEVSRPGGCSYRRTSFIR